MPLLCLSLLHFLAFSIPGPLGKSSDVSEESRTVSVAIPSSAQVAFLMQGAGVSQLENSSLLQNGKYH